MTLAANIPSQQKLRVQHPSRRIAQLETPTHRVRSPRSAIRMLEATELLVMVLALVTPFVSGEEEAMLSAVTVNEKYLGQLVDICTQKGTMKAPLL